MPNYYHIVVNSGGTIAVNTNYGGSAAWTVGRIGSVVTDGSIWLGGTLAIDTTYGDFTYDSGGTPSWELRGQMALGKIGTGTLTLVSANDYHGGTKIYAGTLKAPTTAVLPGFDENPDERRQRPEPISRDLRLQRRYAGRERRWKRMDSGRTLAVSSATALEYAGSQLAIDTSSGDFTYDGTGANQIRGQVGLTKIGANKLILATDQAYQGATVVSQGNLAANGSIATSSGVSLASNTILSGFGTVSTVSGAGLVSPGGSPGILTGTSVNPSGGLGFGFEFTQTGSPIYNAVTASGNDVLHLTGATPVSGSMTSANAIGVYFDVTTLAAGNQFRGGIYEDVATNFLSNVSGATYNYYVLGNGGGTHAFNGVNYYTLAEYDPVLSVSLSTVGDTANFASGTVNGDVMQFSVIPEPDTLILLATGLLGLVAYAWRKRK